VVFESMFGNTQVIARAVAEGLWLQGMSVDIEEVGAAPTVIGHDVDLLVVGGPTHAFGLSRQGTRRSAAQQPGRAVVSAGMGLREWLGTVRGSSASVAAAAFDTRIKKPRLPGSAARAAEKRLRRLGFRILATATSFHVAGTLVPRRGRGQRWHLPRSVVTHDLADRDSDVTAQGSVLGEPSWPARDLRMGTPPEARN